MSSPSTDGTSENTESSVTHISATDSDVFKSQNTINKKPKFRKNNVIMDSDSGSSGDKNDISGRNIEGNSDNLFFSNVSVENKKSTFSNNDPHFSKNKNNSFQNFHLNDLLDDVRKKITKALPKVKK